MDREVKSVEFRYLLEHEVDGTDRGHLVDALEDEEFRIRELLGEAEMVRQIRDGVLRFEHASPVRLLWFGDCVRTLSVYLSEYIVGLERAEGRNAAGLRVEVELSKYVGRVGELIAVPLTHRIDFASGEVVPGPEDIEYLTVHFHELPRWAQDGYRLKFPELRRLG